MLFDFAENDNSVLVDDGSEIMLGRVFPVFKNNIRITNEDLFIGTSAIFCEKGIARAGIQCMENCR